MHFVYHSPRLFNVHDVRTNVQDVCFDWLRLSPLRRHLCGGSIVSRAHPNVAWALRAFKLEEGNVYRSWRTCTDKPSRELYAQVGEVSSQVVFLSS